MIREVVERISRPLRRRRWNQRRAHAIKVANNSTFDVQVPCTWDERDPDDVKLDVHRFLKEAREEFKKKQYILIDPQTGRVATHDVESDVVDMGGMQAKFSDVEQALEGEALLHDDVATWASQKKARVAKRRADLKQALRMKVPRGFEEGV